VQRAAQAQQEPRQQRVREQGRRRVAADHDVGVRDVDDRCRDAARGERGRAVAGARDVAEQLPGARRGDEQEYRAPHADEEPGRQPERVEGCEQRRDRRQADVEAGTAEVGIGQPRREPAPHRATRCEVELGLRVRREDAPGVREHDDDKHDGEHREHGLLAPIPSRPYAAQRGAQDVSSGGLQRAVGCARAARRRRGSCDGAGYCPVRCGRYAHRTGGRHAQTGGGSA
jgi:hypothetical protein